MATAATTHSRQATPHRPPLFLAFELGANTWKLGFTTGAAQRPLERRMPAGAVQVLLEEIARARRRFGLPEDAPVISCYEAGRDGFWLHRFLGTLFKQLSSRLHQPPRPAARHQAHVLPVGTSRCGSRPAAGGLHGWPAAGAAGDGLPMARGGAGGVRGRRRQVCTREKGLCISYTRYFHLDISGGSMHVNASMPLQNEHCGTHSGGR